MSTDATPTPAPAPTPALVRVAGLPFPLPASYALTAPAATPDDDPTDLATTLHLLPDSTFTVTSTSSADSPIDGGTTADGKWTYDRETRRLALSPSSGKPKQVWQVGVTTRDVLVSRMTGMKVVGKQGGEAEYPLPSVGSVWARVRAEAE